MKLPASVFLAFLLCSPVMCQETAAEDQLVVHIQAVFVSDDDGGRRVNCTPQQVKQWVDFANKAFASARISFVFQPNTDYCSSVKSTLINSMTGISDKTWHEARKAANKIAADYPGRLTVFFRYGPGSHPTGGGFSWFDYNFVAMPGFENAGHCGHAHTDALAHEIGHYLGLPHTFGYIFETVAEAESWFKEKGNDPAVFDGDGFSDTPPDPLIRPLECERRQYVILNGVEFLLPRRNLMSYYDERDMLSPQQISRVRWVLRTRMKHGMAMPTNEGIDSPLEAEKLEVIEKHNCHEGLQQMSSWGAHQWSGGAQLFCKAESDGHITLAFPVTEPGRKLVSIYATQSYDYGIVRVSIDGKQIGEVLDTYAPVVIPSGKLELGEVDLKPGQHELRFDVAGKNRESSGYSFGIDSVVLEPSKR